MTFRKRLFIYLFLSLICFISIILVTQVRRDKAHKKELLKSQLSTYTQLINSSSDIEILLPILPNKLRITLISNNGEVFFDNTIALELQDIENHITRPELIAAIEKGEGTAIRESETTHIDYFYYAKQYSDKFIRVALPFDIDLKKSLNADIYFILFLLVLFLIAAGIIFMLYDKLGRSVLLLKNFVQKAEEGIYSKDQLSALEDEISAEIGTKILNAYSLIEEKNEEIEIQKESTKEIKMQMTNNIAHELRTPVSSISGYLETLIKFKDQLEPERAAFYLNRAYLQVGRLSNLIRDISLISQIESPQRHFPRENINLREMLNDLILDYNEQIEKESVQIKLNIPSTVNINGNFTLLQAIFSNLIDNSIKYGKQNNTVHIHINLTSTTPTHYHFSFYDEGIGVAQEHLLNIFNRFYRIDLGRSRSMGGSGLGLSIVKNAVLYHNGEISAHSSEEASVGLTFYFSIATGQ